MDEKRSGKKEKRKKKKKTGKLNKKLIMVSEYQKELGGEKKRKMGGFW